jgi:hypothetical protein
MFVPEFLTGAAMQRILSPIVIIAFALSLSGCSIVGSSIGRTFAAQASRGLSRLDRVDDLSEASYLTLITTHNDTLKGELTGFKEFPEYNRTYHERVTGTPLGVVIPAPQAEAIILAHEEGRFSGVSQYKFRAKVLGFDSGIIRLLPSDRKYSRILPLSELDSMLSVGGASIDSATLRGMFRERRVPFISELGILNLQDTLWIRCDDIDAILPESSGNGELIGLLVGAAVDVAVLVVIISLDEHMNLFSYTK